jgi:hypothetical protein
MFTGTAHFSEVNVALSHRSMIGSRPLEWMYAVSSAMKAHNAVIIRMTGESPFDGLPEIISLLSERMEKIRPANAKIPINP